MKFAYADPPYPGCAHLYPENREVDHVELIQRLERDYDGFILHTSSPALYDVLAIVAAQCPTRPRVLGWFKPFAAFKPNVSVAYAWEPVIVKSMRKPIVTHRVVMRDWIAQPEESAVRANITMRKGLVGAKPPSVARWAFEMVGAESSDEMDDLYPGTGIITRTWDAWRVQSLPTQLDLHA